MATHTAALALLGGTLLFGLGAAGIAGGCRLCVATRRTGVVLALAGTVTGLLVVLLWLDGRIGRYFPGVLWLAVLAAPVAGTFAVGPRRQTEVATAGWTLTFAVAFGLRLPFGVPLGTAALLGLAIEVLAVTFTAFPAFVVGALFGTHSVVRKQIRRIDRE